jgi:drug/metabolite transporter (DMT)-like permease
MDFVSFSWRHPLFLVHLLSMASLAFIGHIFIYKMIKDFRQHIVPFVITARKIISVGISMFYFHHSSSFMQIVGILIVFSTTLHEFFSEIIKSEPIGENLGGNKNFENLEE